MHIEYDLELFVVHKEMFMFSGIFRNCRWMWRVCTKTHKHWNEFHIDVYDIVIIKYSADNNGIGADKHSILASHHIIISGRKKEHRLIQWLEYGKHNVHIAYHYIHLRVQIMRLSTDDWIMMWLVFTRLFFHTYL